MSEKVTDVGVNENVKTKKVSTDASTDWQMDVVEFNNAGCKVPISSDTDYTSRLDLS